MAWFDSATFLCNEIHTRIDFVHLNFNVIFLNLYLLIDGGFMIGLGHCEEHPIEKFLLLPILGELNILVV
jgi:hypothetical protein